MRVVCLLLLLAHCVSPATAQAQSAVRPVRDAARLFSDAEAAQLQRQAARLQPQLGSDLLIATIDDTTGDLVSLGSHRALVDRAFLQLRQEQDVIDGLPRPLTIVVVFRRAVVLHMKSDLGVLNATLLYNRFYTGLDAAAAKVRLPGTSHGRAALAYLEAVERAAQPLVNIEPGLLQPAVRMAEIAAFTVSRDLWDKITLIPGLLTAVSKAALATTRAFSANQWIALILFGLLVPVVIEVVATLVHMALARSMALSKIGELALSNAAEIATTALNLPFILLVMSVTNYDLENLLALEQNFRVPLADSLRWAAGIATSGIVVPFALLIALAAAAVGLEIRKYMLKTAFYAAARADQAGASEPGIVRLLLKGLLAAFGILWVAVKSGLWLATAVLLSGVTAAYLVVGAVLRRLASCIVLQMAVGRLHARIFDKDGSPSRGTATGGRRG